MRSDDRLTTTVFEKAQQWVSELPSAGLARRLEFVHWIKSSPEHLRAYLLITAFDVEAAGIRSLTELSLEGLVGEQPTGLISSRGVSDVN
jgi:ferric-dicitrate binding protein FerR (iron transport regulator)